MVALLVLATGQLTGCGCWHDGRLIMNEKGIVRQNVDIHIGHGDCATLEVRPPSTLRLVPQSGPDADPVITPTGVYWEQHLRGRMIRIECYWDRLEVWTADRGLTHFVIEIISGKLLAEDDKPIPRPER
jgi:hypothetical protein